MRDILFCQWHKLLGRKFRFPPTGVKPMTSRTLYPWATGDSWELRREVFIYSISSNMYMYREQNVPNGHADCPSRSTTCWTSWPHDQTYIYFSPWTAASIYFVLFCYGRMNMVCMIESTETFLPAQVVFWFLFNVNTFKCLYHGLLHVKYLSVKWSPVELNNIHCTYCSKKEE